MERRKLFSSTSAPAPRRKLFCSESEVESAAESTVRVSRIVRCADCGYTFETEETTAEVYCPKCGGHRFLTEHEEKVEIVQEDEEKEFSITRRKLFSEDSEGIFQKEFAER